MTKKKLSRILGKGCLIAISFFLVERFCHKQTRGFSPSKISYSAPLSAAVESSSLSQQDTSQLYTLLDQPFYFLGSGGQFYVFESADHQIVIKFFKFHHLNYPKILDHIALPPYAEKWKEARNRKRKKIFNSCILALTDLKEETGLVYLQLDHALPFKKKLTLVDNLNIAHEIDLNRTPFVLQKKASLFFPHLNELLSLHDWNGTKDAIRSLIRFLTILNQKGIRDKDRGLKRNVGFIDGYASIIDIGSFEKKVSMNDPEKFKKELLSKTDKLHTWIEKYHPNLMSYYEEQIEEFSLTISPM